MIDALILGCFLVALYFNRSLYPAALSYAVCCLYIVAMFDSHSAVLNHVFYGLIFIPACFSANIRLAAGMLCYSTFHFVVALDYFLYPAFVTPISFMYQYMQVLLALSLIFVGASYDRPRNKRTRLHNFPWLGNI